MQPTSPAPTLYPAAGRLGPRGLQRLLGPRLVRVPALLMALLLPSLASAATVNEAAETSGPDPETAYQSVRAKAEARVEAALGREALGEAGRASAWVAPRALGQVASQLFDSTNLRVSVRAGQRQLPPPPAQPLKTATLAKLDCSPKRGCNSNCGDDCVTRGPLGGKWSDPGCLLSCSGKKAACEAQKGAEKVACEAEKALRGAISDKKIGTFRFSRPELRSGEGTLDDLRLELANGLDRARLRGRLGARAQVAGHVRFTPEPLVQIGILCAEFSGNVGPLWLEAPRQELRMEADLELIPHPEGLELSISFDPVEVDLEVNGDPFLETVLENPQNLLSCTLPVVVGLTVDAFVGTFPIQERIDIPPVESVTLGGLELEPLPGRQIELVRTGRSIGLVERLRAQTAGLDTGPTGAPAAVAGGSPSSPSTPSSVLPSITQEVSR